MPCFEGLLPEPHNSVVQNLLFTCLNWHGHGKLRLQTDSTVGTFHLVVSDLGKELRHFVKVTCAAFETKDTDYELRKRQHEAVKRAESTGQSAAPVN